MSNDETLLGVSEKVKNFCVIYTCDISKVPDFTKVRYTSSFERFGSTPGGLSEGRKRRLMNLTDV